jgi:hypothetical protein
MGTVRVNVRRYVEQWFEAHTAFQYALMHPREFRVRRK